MNASLNNLPRLIRELIWALSSLLGGLMLLPAMVYVVGSRMFGAYKGPATGIGAFYANFSHDLASGHLSSWTMALGPLLFISILRLLVPANPFAALWQKWFRKPAANNDSIGAS